MPAPATNDEFLELVRRAKLVNENFLETKIKRILETDRPAEPHELADRLVEAGVLTYYQAVQLLKGRNETFRIGPYRILERLGFGATSNVYLCEHKATHARMAVKVLTTLQANDPVALRRFYREARAGHELDHPNLVKVYDLDWDGQDNYLVMDFVDGSSLQDIVQQFGAMDVHRACQCVEQAAQGLHYAYQAGLVHRDIKPGNILLDRDGTVRLLDMGLARILGEEGGMLTQGGDVLGTPEYLSPEQAIDSHNVDIRADIYSLGGTLYFLVTGEAPYSEEKSSAGKLLSKAKRPPRPVREIKEDVPEELVAVIDKMMARNPADRYQTPREVSDALAPWTKKSLGKPPEEQMPKLSPAAKTGQAELGKDTPPPVPAGEGNWGGVQIAVVVAVGIAAFVAALWLVGVGQ